MYILTVKPIWQGIGQYIIKLKWKELIIQNRSFSFWKCKNKAFKLDIFFWNGVEIYNTNNI